MKMDRINEDEVEAMHERLAEETRQLNLESVKADEEVQQQTELAKDPDKQEEATKRLEELEQEAVARTARLSELEAELQQLEQELGNEAPVKPAGFWGKVRRTVARVWGWIAPKLKRFGDWIRRNAHDHQGISISAVAAVVIIGGTLALMMPQPEADEAEEAAVEEVAEEVAETQPSVTPVEEAEQVVETQTASPQQASVQAGEIKIEPPAQPSFQGWGSRFAAEGRVIHGLAIAVGPPPSEDEPEASKPAPDEQVQQETSEEASGVEVDNVILDQPRASEPNSGQRFDVIERSLEFEQ